MAPKKKFRRQNASERGSVGDARAKDWEASLKGRSVLKALRVEPLVGSGRWTRMNKEESLLKLRQNFCRKLDELVEEYTVELRREFRKEFFRRMNEWAEVYKARLPDGD
jgi:hypothetical protein